MLKFAALLDSFIRIFYAVHFKNHFKYFFWIPETQKILSQIIYYGLALLKKIILWLMSKGRCQEWCAHCCFCYPANLPNLVGWSSEPWKCPGDLWLRIQMGAQQSWPVLPCMGLTWEDSSGWGQFMMCGFVTHLSASWGERMPRPGWVGTVAWDHLPVASLDCLGFS